MDVWQDLSDAEVMSRLLRRGVEPVQAKGWVRDRESEYAAEEIGAVLDKEYYNPDEPDKAITFEIPIEKRIPR